LYPGPGVYAGPGFYPRFYGIFHFVIVLKSLKFDAREYTCFTVVGSLSSNVVETCERCLLTGGWRQCVVLLEKSVLVHQPAADAEQADQVEALAHDGISLFLLNCV